MDFDPEGKRIIALDEAGYFQISDVDTGVKCDEKLVNRIGQDEGKSN